ncbi:sulfotransferase family 2 domain-containing protein [Roseovarius aestuariivivens]|uniref:sulfotransferase family 2 domain-containing protein n=1 Tax=Roseovarius aestuariivivens TaxID=1888910 RepID=UPI001081E566|nr:sulfotransferase family 2 domain-containing protein [Roseovarius aestuariivivens]
MIYLKEMDVIFIKPRKVAGTSFEIALSEFATERDIITPISPEDEATRRALGFRGAQNYLKAPIEYSAGDLYRFLRRRVAPQKYFNHISAKQLRNKIGAKVFDNAKKISIVRNPFDRLVSLFHWRLKLQRPDEGIDFSEFLRQNPELLRLNYEHYFIDQRFILNHTIKYETLLEDCKTVESEVPTLKGLSNSMKNINAKGGFRPKGRDLKDYFYEEDELVSAVKFFNREIIDMFGYESPLK